MSNQFKLPALAENVDAVTVTKVFVSVGDEVAVDQPVLEIETDKAAAEVPSDVSGTVTEIRTKEGELLHVGDVVLVLKDNGKAAPAKTPEKKEDRKKEDKKREDRTTPEQKAAAKAEPPKAAPKLTAAPEEKDTGVSEDEAVEEEAPAEEAERLPARRPASAPVAASPSVRRLAREIGVDINEVPGTGPHGHVSMDDVKAYSRRVNTDVRGASAGMVAITVPLPDFSRWGEIERQAMNSVRRRTAENMAASWNTVPHVTQFDKVDITELERMRQRYGKRVEAAGGKLTATAVIVKVLASALKKFPQFNASIDVASNEVIYKKFYNIGVAVDTDRGLLVPVIHHVDQKNIIEIAVELSDLAERARERKSKLEEMQGGTFTVSNLGGIGGTAFTPIVNPPEVAILGISRSRVEPAFVDGAFEPRTMLPLALSYDHRVIDGADGARFMRWLVETLEQPFLLFLEG